MVQARELTKGMVVEMDGNPCLVQKIAVQTPSARGGNTLYKVRARNLVRGGKLEKTFKGGDTLPQPDFERRSVQFVFKTDKTFTFMDMTDFEQFSLSNEEVEDESPWLDESVEEIFSLLVDGKVIGIQVPDTVDLPIVECSPGVRGNSATGRTKPATLPSGHAVQVPEYLDPGEMIRIDTRSGKYVSRVSS